MLSFFKKLRSSEPKQETEAGSVIEETNDTPAEEVASAVLPLHFPQDVDTGISMEERYVLQFFVGELPEMAEGELSIDGYKLTQDEAGMVLQAIMRNNMDADIEVGTVPVVLIDAHHNMVARSMFDLTSFGEIPARTAMPCRFFLPYSDFRVQQADFSNWMVGFHMEDGRVMRAVTELDFEQSGDFSQDEHVEAQDQQVLDAIERAIHETEGQVNMFGTSLGQGEHGELVVELLLRNGKDEVVELTDGMVFTVLDAARDEVASQAFDFSAVKVEPKSVQRLVLEYDAATLKKAEPDFSEWSVDVK
ncbi:SLAP domain-containing protein [Aneurinibacillus soli]|uniref:Uncharacterized protein n=1 Tax=Aneurinibacillus soli TaxID=1500254 RepID=A0A0U5B8L2_9BACL|nr:SLAP domain-containing protein [Aneurinibacillus soli]PYE61510.1 SLAP domain-containing protein [Aneurinibacillus soli]BAU26535.1 hypothetical protein CB4_00662 [Aneurinibacillus soli]